MKTVVVCIVISMLLGSIAISMNLLLGMSIHQAWFDIFNPFQVMEPIELAVLFSLISLWIFNTCLHLFRKKNQHKEPEQRPH
ncbi:hypothetical protein CI793_02690 [Anoxybacillus ayderensis]|uniref:hypothetical protein n=1 Tax=Anoxybacillus gonensis TaxID=198467 RepID=UPI000369E83D|nr:hypothetical protein [Anoxybacillus gonensis]AXM90148.1 hypothetical protein B379_13845 [Anoxybacillus ayderensis G10]MCQ5365874.1 hypothetical protein [Anoxybacillus gonensis]THD17669.1 hypothetical protein CI793_02690 [Anoxybacillus ayderensis]